jgi:anti-sigma B factor antagonist
MLSSTRIADYALDTRTHAIEIEGEIDLHAAPSMQERIDAVLERGKTRVIVDLSAVRYIDSTGLTVLLGALKRLRRDGGALALVVTDYDIERMLESTGLDGMFAVHRSRDEALEHFGGTR